MDSKDILSRCDHTLLKQDATWEQIKSICDEGKAFNCASVCIPPAYVKRAAEYVGNDLKICTVIGFPNGYSTTEVKVFETEGRRAQRCRRDRHGHHLGWVKDCRWDDLLEEMKSVKASCAGAS